MLTVVLPRHLKEQLRAAGQVSSELFMCLSDASFMHTILHKCCSA